MLSISAGLAPDNGSRCLFNRLAIAVNTLAIAFHIALLKISGKAMHILIIR